MATDRALIVATALSYEGVPFVHQGRSRSGLDCVGLVVRVAHDLGITDFDEANYARNPDSGRLIQLLDEHMVKKPLIDAEPADLILMSLVAGRPKHVALLVDYDRILHTYYAAGQVVASTLTNYWASRVRGCYSFAGDD